MKGVLEEVKSTLDELSLSDDAKAEAVAELATIQAQLQSPRPKRGTIRESLQAVLRFLEPIAQKVAVTAATTHLPDLVKKIGEWVAKLG